jgi:hypothetical protein
MFFLKDNSGFFFVFTDRNNDAHEIYNEKKVYRLYLN